MPSLSADPLCSTLLAISSITSMPAATQPQQRIADHDVGLGQTIDQMLTFRRQLAGGIVAAALEADGVHPLPVGRLLDEASDFARSERWVTDERDVPAHGGAGVEHPRFHAG